jgi:hypothetical protein
LDSNGKQIDSLIDIKTQRKIFVGTSNGLLYQYTGQDSTGKNKVKLVDSVYHYTTDLALTLGDLTGDDKLDFIIGQKSGGISVLLKDGGNIVAPPPIDTTDTTDTTSIYESTQNNSAILKVYPNPTSGTFTIEIGGESDLDNAAQIRDLTGRVVLNGNNVQERTFDISDLPAGIYWLEISIESKKMYQQIVKVDH